MPFAVGNKNKSAKNHQLFHNMMNDLVTSYLFHNSSNYQSLQRKMIVRKSDVLRLPVDRMSCTRKIARILAIYALKLYIFQVKHVNNLVSVVFEPKTHISVCELPR